MNKVIKRLLVFFIGIPVVLGIVFLNFYNHILLNIALCITSGIAASEFYNMLRPNYKLYNKAFVIILCILLPLLSYIFIFFGLSVELAPWFFVLEIFVLLAVESLFNKEFSNSLTKTAFTLLIIFYAGLLPTFISRMTVWNNSVYFLSLYFILVFMCDSSAWFFGVLFGKNNRGYFAASPNKSIVGFFGGIFGSTLCGYIFTLIFPDVFDAPLYSIIILGIFTSLAAIIGDLIESVFKRSAKCKDSGTIIPGRGGLLDSIDSLLVAAPIFYIGVHFLY